MIPILNSLKKIKTAALGVVSSLIIISCGSYQSVSYDSDGIYSSNTQQVQIAQAPVSVPATAPAANPNSYFTQKLQEYENAASGGDVLTDIENYSSQNYDQTQQQYDDNAYYPGWGQDPQQQTTQIYANVGWGYNNFYPFWNRGFRNGWNNWGWGVGWNNWGWNDPFWNGGFYGPGFYGGGLWGNNLWYGNGFYRNRFNNNFYGNRRYAYNRNNVRSTNRNYTPRYSRSNRSSNSRTYSPRQSSSSSSARSSNSSRRTYSPRQSSSSSSSARSSNSSSRSSGNYSPRSSNSSNRSYSPRSSGSSSRASSSSARSSRSSSSSRGGSYRRR